MYNIELIKEKTIAFIQDRTFAEKTEVKDHTLIFKNGYLDSMGFVTLITFLESEFKITTQDKDLIEENFESVNAISSYVMRKAIV